MAALSHGFPQVLCGGKYMHSISASPILIGQCALLAKLLGCHKILIPFLFAYRCSSIVHSSEQALHVNNCFQLNKPDHALCLNFQNLDCTEIAYHINDIWVLKLRICSGVRIIA
jgi:hypothetical protein